MIHHKIDDKLIILTAKKTKREKAYLGLVFRKTTVQPSLRRSRSAADKGRSRAAAAAGAICRPSCRPGRPSCPGPSYPARPSPSSVRPSPAPAPSPAVAAAPARCRRTLPCGGLAGAEGAGAGGRDCPAVRRPPASSSEPACRPATRPETSARLARPLRGYRTLATVGDHSLSITDQPLSASLFIYKVI